MPKNIALIIGIDDYNNPERKLPACKNDALLMQSILRRGGRFDEIHLFESEDAEIIKSKFASTINRYDSEDIDQLLFYFSGHGCYEDDDLRYQLRDYNESSMSVTSLSNEELDSLLKSISPNVLIKIVDACHSGAPYIKDGTTLVEKTNEYTKSLFPNFYFMCSSQADQKSYSGESLSYFTSAFANTIIDSKVEEIRYTHIISSISDKFKENKKQHPYFISQARHIETIGFYRSEIREEISKEITEINLSNEKIIGNTQETPSDIVEIIDVSEDHHETNQINIIELVEAAEKNYVSKEDALAIITNLQKSLENLPAAEISDLYTIQKIFHSDYPNLPDEEKIGSWLELNSDGEYFAQPTHKLETYEVENSVMGMLNIISPGLPKRTKTRTVVSGIETKMTNVPFLCCQLILTPKKASLLQFGGWITYIISKTKIQIFHCFVEYKEHSWGEYSIHKNTTWKRDEYNLSDAEEVNKIVNYFYKSLVDWVSQHVKIRLEKYANENILKIKLSDKS